MCNHDLDTTASPVSLNIFARFDRGLSSFLKMKSLVAITVALLPITFALPAPDWDGSNLLIPDDKGVLHYASPAQLKARHGRAPFEVMDSLRKRDDCSDKVFMGDLANCAQYCERVVSDVTGAPTKVSPDINCNIGDTCDIAHTEAVTITEGFSINLGGNSPAGPEGNAIVSAGVSFSWSKAETTSDTWTFHPKNGKRASRRCSMDTKETRQAILDTSCSGPSSRRVLGCSNSTSIMRLMMASKSFVWSQSQKMTMLPSTLR